MGKRKTDMGLEDTMPDTQMCMFALQTSGGKSQTEAINLTAEANADELKTLAAGFKTKRNRNDHCREFLDSLANRRDPPSKKREQTGTGNKEPKTEEE